MQGAKEPKVRREDTDSVVKRLYKETLIRRPGERDVTQTGGRKNKNEILALTLARLVKETHLNGNKYSHDIDLVRGIPMKTNNSEFILILRMDGRIVAISDEAEHHLKKSMRSLYAQCINIFECLDKTDCDKLRPILNSSVDLPHQEHRLVCTFRLPKGKRPSRVREDIKAISMAGHFFSCHEPSSSSYERLFIARCQALVSRTTNTSSSSQTTVMMSNNDNTNTMIEFILNEDMSINMISPNVKDILGYSRNEMIGNWLGRYLATNDLEKFEAIRQRYFQHQEQSPISICDVFDMYTNNGDGRLTFLCQIRPRRERRTKPVKFVIVAQLIDPSLRNEYIKYVQGETETNPTPIKAEQYHQQHRRRAKIPSWPIVRHSPWVSSCSVTPSIMTLPISSTIRPSIGHSQTLLHRSTSLMNLSGNYSTSNIINIQQQQISTIGQQTPSMMPSSDVNPYQN